MWFMFGLITLISFSVYFGIQRFQARWQGSRSVIGAPSYEHQFVYRGKSKNIRQMMVGVDAPKAFDFSFKRESWLDRVFKWLGISVERQFGADDFDKLVYVVSNDRHLFDEVMDDAALLQTLTALFRIKHFDCRISNVHCRNGRLWAVFKVGRLFNDSSNIGRLSQIFPVVAKSLHAVADRLKADLPRSTGTRRDPFILRAIVVLAISTGLLVNGLVHAFRLLTFSYSFTVDSAELWTYAVFSGAAIIMALVILAIFLLGRTARTHLVLIELIVVGSLGAVLTAFTEIRDLNMDLDTSPVQRFEARVLDKTISKSRKGGTRYYLHVPGWTGRDWTGLSDTERLQVSSEFYQRMQKGERIEIWQRSGFLGIGWVEGLRRPDSARLP